VQVCRRQVYEGSSKAALPEQRVEKVARSTNDVLASLFALMNQCAESGTVQAEQQRLLRAIDLFFQESSRREQQCYVTATSPPQRQDTTMPGDSGPR